MTEKKYDLIFLPNNGVVVIDKAAQLSGAVIHLTTLQIGEHQRYGLEHSNSYIKYFDEAHTGLTKTSNNAKIIAAYPALEGVTLLPPLPTDEDDVIIETIIKSIPDFPYYPLNNLMAERIIQFGLRCYKARAAKGAFTLEQVKRAIHDGFYLAKNQSSSEYPDTEYVNETLQSLTNTRKPIAVVLEMEECEFVNYGDAGDRGEWKPKLDANGFVIVKRWIYE